MKHTDAPSPWQKKSMWAALTAVSIAVTFAVAVGFVFLFSQVMGFLQPILVPFAVAGVLAYLLEPAVTTMMRWGTTRDRAVWAVFGITSLAFAALLVWIVPSISVQSERLARKVPEITRQAQVRITLLTRFVHEKYGVQLVPEELLSKKVAHKAPANDQAQEIIAPPPEFMPAPTVSERGKDADQALANPNNNKPDFNEEEREAAVAASTATEQPLIPSGIAAAEHTPLFQDLFTGDWVSTTLPTFIKGVWKFFSSSLGGFLGIFGFLLSFVIVPLYLFYFLTEAPNISNSWSRYLPLKASYFKDEVVATLTEVNGYLIAFFRGQLVVSIINGTATAVGLTAIGLDFGFLIGLALCCLGVIPYIGIALCWIPAAIIASVQGGNWFLPHDSEWWVFPLVVTGVFAIVQWVDGLFITPKIVGERVGLHPVTVIFSVLLWSLLLGGLLGAILAVPLTAIVKVLLRRYVWERTLMAEAASSNDGSGLAPS